MSLFEDLFDQVSNLGSSWISCSTFGTLLLKITLCLYPIQVFWRWVYSKTKITQTVEILLPERTDMSEEFVSAIRTLLSWEPPFQRFLGKNMLYKYELCDDAGSLQEKFPLIVLCPICSRLEEDIDAAICNINWNIEFVVVLLHSCLESFLPEYPTRWKLASKHEYHNVEFIDIAIDMDAKLYRCKMNEDARIQLHNFIERFYNTCT